MPALVAVTLLLVLDLFDHRVGIRSGRLIQRQRSVRLYQALGQCAITYLIILETIQRLDHCLIEKF